jgi:hypothetical protein
MDSVIPSARARWKGESIKAKNCVSVLFAEALPKARFVSLLDLPRHPSGDDKSKPVKIRNRSNRIATTAATAAVQRRCWRVWMESVRREGLGCNLLQKTRNQVSMPHEQYVLFAYGSWRRRFDGSFATTKARRKIFHGKSRVTS